MMNIFSTLYNKMLVWSANPRATYILAGVSFAESSFFPIPPDVMLMSMGLSKPKASWRYATIATLFSVLGGIFGYVIGYFGMGFIEPYLMASSYAPYVQKVKHWFDDQGVWVVIFAGFSPFPYKIFTITAGMMQMSFWPFIIGSLIGRGLRFFIVSGVLYFFGEKIEPHLRRYINTIVWSLLGVLLIIFLLTGCTDSNELAPVEEHRWHVAHSHDKTVTVKSGDTLYSIAFRYDLDYRQMAAYNHLKPPYTVKIGQVLQLLPGHYSINKPPQPRLHPLARQQQPIIQASPPVVISNEPAKRAWRWPAQGNVVARFSPQSGIKGINIAGKRGDKIYAAGDGVVAYSGNGLTGYGNLIIIKHNNQFLTAYGHNLQNHVREGQTVKAGQVIADMGMIERRFWGVHFEIRRMGQPVNPLSYIGTH